MEWKTVKLGEVCENIYSGGTPSSMNPEFWDGDLPWLSSGETSQRYIYKTEKYITKLGVEKSSTRYAEKGSTVIASAGQGHTRGQASMLCLNTYINQSILVLKPNLEKVHPSFLYFNLDSRYNELRQFSDGNSTRGSLSGRILKDLTISLPPLETQRRIAAILSSLDDKIENNNRINRNLEAQAQALFKSWFVDFEPWEGTMPNDWRKQKLGQIIELYRGVSYSSKDIKEGDYALLSMNNIRPWGGFLYDFSRKFSGRFKEIHKLNPYDLIMCITDITQERRLIGYTALIPPYYDNLIMCTHLLKVTSEKYDSIFLNGLFNYSGLSRFIADCATGTTVLGLTADIVKGIEWTIPTPEAAKEYSNMVIDMYDSIFRNNQENLRLAALRETLSPKLMKGEIEL